MKKVFILFLLFSLISCTKETTIYTKKPNFNDLTIVEIDYIDDIGVLKLEKITKEMENGEFKNKKDFERRMYKKLSPVMIKKIIKEFDFTAADGGT